MPPAMSCDTTPGKIAIPVLLLALYMSNGPTPTGAYRSEFSRIRRTTRVYLLS